MVPPSPIDLDVPERFKQHGITRIYQTGPVVKALYKDTPIAINFDVTKLKTFAKNFREAAGKVITSNGTDASELIEKLIQHIVNQATTAYEQGVTQGGSGNGSGISSNNNNDQKKQQQVAVMKYTIERDSGLQLWETVKIQGRYYLVSFDHVNNKLSCVDEISGPDKTLVPYSEEGIEHYTFQNIDELNQYITLARNETAGSLFRKVKDWAVKFYDTDTVEYINLIAGDVLFSYFHDKLGKTHYIFVWGPPDQGKGTVLETFNQLGYRAVFVTDATAATIYRILGSVEKGQAILVIDEANNIEDNTFVLNVLKVGYKGNTKIPRVMDAQSSENSKVEYFFPYGFKIIAAEKLPSIWKTGGFRSRCLEMKTAPGDPQIDIGDVVDNAGDPRNAAILSELNQLRKLLFAYRLLHYHEPIPDIKLKGITGRDRELTKPLIRLFKTHGGDTTSLDTIKDTMHYFIKERNSDKSERLEAGMLKLIKNLIILDPDDRGEFTYKHIWENAKQEFNGSDIEGKSGTMDTDSYGEINSKRLAGVLRAIGGKKARDSSGTKRVWKFETKTLERFSRVYKEIPDTIELEEITTTKADDEDEEEREEENDE